MPNGKADKAVGEATPVEGGGGIGQPEGNNLPEAPASATVRVWIEGYGVLLTMRDERVSEVVKKLGEIVEHAKKAGWKSSWKEEKETKTKPCPKCDGTMEYRSGTSKKGKKYAGWFCSEDKEHIEWVNSK